MKQILFGALLSLTLAACKDSKTEEPKMDNAADSDKTAAMAPKPIEFADARYTEMARNEVAALQSKDVDGYMSAFADNASYHFNSGDSVMGKAAITEMWKKNFKDLIDTMTLSNPIYLPVIVNEPQSNIAKGTYMLSWYTLNAKFKNGAKTMQEIHVVVHFDGNDKIERVDEFIDRSGFPKPKK